MFFATLTKQITILYALTSGPSSAVAAPLESTTHVPGTLDPDSAPKGYAMPGDDEMKILALNTNDKGTIYAPLWGKNVPGGPLVTPAGVIDPGDTSVYSAVGWSVFSGLQGIGSVSDCTMIKATLAQNWASVNATVSEWGPITDLLAEHTMFFVPDPSKAPGSTDCSWTGDKGSSWNKEWSG